ncbi:MAG: hypothetical protein ACD_15C00177G0002 [uncultured bacterium]|nr:MAG: hypothetical protein ACD_15C00177G0002 [uncultured bacterium]HCU70594.1 hypothetical protein [Candidatus Moranbacteria bacterium]
MVGMLLIFVGSFFVEIFDSIGKNKVNNHEESRSTMAFLSVFWGAIFLFLIAIFKEGSFVFQVASLPILLVRVVLDIIQTYVTVTAISRADRTTFGFIRIITIPLLLLVDVYLGYEITPLAMGGVFIIIMGLMALSLNKGIGKDGVGWVTFSAVNGVITISLFKYNITHFNSVVADQLLVYMMTLIFFTLFSVFREKENPFAFLKKPQFLLQSVSVGIGGIIESFAYNYGAASVITAAKRVGSIFWSVVSGGLYFHEQKIMVKILIFFILATGIVFLTV